jgi:hypothetical protein
MKPEGARYHTGAPFFRFVWCPWGI